MKIATVIGLTLGLAFGLAEAQPKPESTGPAIQDGSTVQLEYTLTDGQGKMLDSNKGGEPLAYTQGRRQIIPGLEKTLDGMHAGEEKKVTLAPADGYGDIDPAATTEIPRQLIPADALAVGTELVAQGESGGQRIVRIKEIKETTVILDLNHPLAGETLVFDVKVLGVSPPAPGK